MLNAFRQRTVSAEEFKLPLVIRDSQVLVKLGWGFRVIFGMRGL